jgi:hypothetical protein
VAAFVKRFAIGGFMTVELVRVISRLPVRVWPGATVGLLGALLPASSLEPAKELRAIARTIASTASRIAKAEVCD